MFDQLKMSGVGTQLLDYLERLLDSVNDSRSWETTENKTHADKTTRVIKQNLIDKIKQRADMTPKKPYQFK